MRGLAARSRLWPSVKFCTGRAAWILGMTPLTSTLILRKVHQNGRGPSHFFSWLVLWWITIMWPQKRKSYFYSDSPSNKHMFFLLVDCISIYSVPSGNNKTLTNFSLDFKRWATWRAAMMTITTTNSNLCLCVQAAISERLPDSEDHQPADGEAPRAAGLLRLPHHGRSQWSLNVHKCCEIIKKNVFLFVFHR